MFIYAHHYSSDIYTHTLKVQQQTIKKQKRLEIWGRAQREAGRGVR